MKQFNYKGIIIECQRCVYKCPNVSFTHVGVSMVIKEQYGTVKHEVSYLYPFEKALPQSAHEAYIIWPTRPHIVNPTGRASSGYLVTFNELREAWQNGKQQEND